MRIARGYDRLFGRKVHSQMLPFMTEVKPGEEVV
jgi:hypothetical protein